MMTTKAELLALAEKVEAGEAHTIELDVVFMTGMDLAATATIDRALKGSLDAAKALHDAVLPGAGWGLYWDEVERRFGANVYVQDREDKEAYELDYGMADNPAAAWVAAILRAKAQGQDDG